MARHTDFGDRGPKCGNVISDHSGAMGSDIVDEYHSIINQDDNLISLFSGYESYSITEPFADEDYIVGAGYNVRPLEPLQNELQNLVRFSIEIDHWIFTHKHVFMRQPVISFIIEINSSSPEQFRLSDVKVMMRTPTVLDARTANNLVEAAIIFMKTIKDDHVPKCESILKKFGIHPDSISQNKDDMALDEDRNRQRL